MRGLVCSAPALPGIRAVNCPRRRASDSLIEAAWPPQHDEFVQRPAVHPFAVRHVILRLHELVLRRPTLSCLQRMDVSQWWPRPRLESLQNEKLRRLLAHAGKNCPFYRRRLDEAGLDPERACIEAL